MKDNGIGNRAPKGRKKHAHREGPKMKKEEKGEKRDNVFNDSHPSSRDASRNLPTTARLRRRTKY